MSHSPVVPEVKMYRVGDLREVVARNTAGTGCSEAASILSNRVFTCVCSLWLFMAHTWMSSSSRLVRMPSRHSTKSGRWGQPNCILWKGYFESYSLFYLSFLTSCFLLTLIIKFYLCVCNFLSQYWNWNWNYTLSQMSSWTSSVKS